MSKWGGYTGPFCPLCLAHLVPLVRSPDNPQVVGHRCPNCGFEELTERGEMILNY